jgi:vacuolar-type H+-ATPase subunit B/Vma2
MLPLLAPILTQLAGAGLQKVVDAVLDKGTAVVEEKLGITLTPDANGKLSDEKIASLKEAAMKHEEFMFEQEVKDRSSARQREVDIATNENVPLINKIITPALAIFVVLS